MTPRGRLRRAAVAGLLLVSVATGAGSHRAPAPQSVLFIGNSYTYYHNLPELVGQIADGVARGSAPIRGSAHSNAQRARAVPSDRNARMTGVAQGFSPARSTGSMHTALCAAGGATLSAHFAGGRCARMLASRPWDLVILQEQSTLGRPEPGDRNGISDPRRTFWPGVRQWDDEIRRRGARTGLLLTWARRDRPEQQPHLTDAYVAIGRERGALVVPAGPAWQAFRRAHPHLPLHDEDGSHPSALGSYLTAVTVLSAVLDRRVPTFSRPLLVHPAADGEIGVARTDRVDVPDAARAHAHEIAWQTWVAWQRTK